MMHFREVILVHAESQPSKMYVFVMLLEIISNETLNPEPIVFCGHKDVKYGIRLIF